MIKDLKKISIVCYANYCRSPVAEKLLAKKLSDKIEFSSCGLNPKVEANMDYRSSDFLEQNDITSTYHVPKKISEEIIKNSDLILCMDAHVLMHLNLKFSKYKSKYKIFSYICPEIRIEDPYRMDSSKYIAVMEKIKDVSERYNYQDLFN